MPDIRSLKVGLLWVAFSVDDYGRFDTPRWGFTSEHARQRTLRDLP